MNPVTPRASLLKLEPELTRLADRVAALAPADLASPSNLNNWTVTDLAVHITRVCDSILLAVKRALDGDRTPAFGPAAKPREDEIRAMSPADWAELQRAVYRDLTVIIDGCTDEALDAYTFPHPQGERPITWYCTQILAETAFHRWDLERSLGADGPLDDELAAYLLHFLLDPSRQLFSARKVSEGAEAFTLVAGDQHWHLTVTADGCAVSDVPEGAAITITGSPGWLALAVYGRVRIDRPEITIAGGNDAAERFAAIFGS